MPLQPLPAIGFQRLAPSSFVFQVRLAPSSVLPCNAVGYQRGGAANHSGRRICATCPAFLGQLMSPEIGSGTAFPFACSRRGGCRNNQGPRFSYELLVKTFIPQRSIVNSSKNQ